MVDKNTIFGGMLTLLGAAKKTNCDALGIPWEPRFMLIGDANGTDPVPDPSQTTLVNQVYRAQLNQLYVSPTDNNVLVAELVLPPDVGGWWVRELALEDKDGVFSAVSNVAPSYKPQLAQNSGRNQVVRMHIITSSTANIQLKIDPSVVLATRAYVDTKIMEELYKLDSKQSVRVATTDNIVRSGLLTIDGVLLSAGDRVLVKNQIVSKDNGLYVAAAGAWPRGLDADSNAEMTSALLVSVEQGATLADTRWQLVTDGAIVLGATALTFQNITQGFAPINAPALINPTANTPAQFNNSQLLATTEFVQREKSGFAGFTSFSVSRSLTAADIGKALWPSVAGLTLTLPTPASLGLANGTGFTIFATSIGWTMVAGAGVFINGVGGVPVSPIAVKYGQSAMVFAAGANTWQLIYSAVDLGSNADFAGSISTTGWQRLPSGDIEQFGIANAGSGVELVINLPVTMLAAPYNIQLTFADYATSWAVGSSPVLQARAATTGSITVRNLNTTSSSFFWTVRGKA